MNPALHALEWPRFLGYAEQEARTEPAKARVRSWSDASSWANRIETCLERQAETAETSALLERDGLWGPLTDLRDPSAILETLGRKGVLELADLVVLRGWLVAIDAWMSVPRDEVRGERFARALGALAVRPDPLRALERVLTPEGEMSERASPRLAQIHLEIRGLKREIGVTMDGLAKSLHARGIVQDAFSDIRDGRYVIPVKISHQSEVEGIIFEASASRQTVFVEPREVSPLNNRLRKLQNELIQEIFVVLQQTSRMLEPHAAAMLSAIEIIAHWDAVQARARIGRVYGGKPIEVHTDRKFKVIGTAHPLLWWSLPPEKIVRNSVEFGEPARTLLLTGPNTGGKTVLLKTLGMAGVCARTGFPFPALDTPEVPYFDRFFADLGDAQSIEAHLSSFAGHVMRFKEMLETVSGQSLALIDELNAATDPEEGAALGRAVLETVMAQGAMVVSTTHDPHLKALALSDSRVLNASMAFDEAARTPTYKILLGVPGRSRALETAERLGVPARVLQLARSYLSKQHLELEAMLSGLQDNLAASERARTESEGLRAEAEKLNLEWTERVRDGLSETLDRTRQRMRRMLDQAQDEVRATVRRLEEASDRKQIGEAREALSRVAGAFSDRVESALLEEAPDAAAALGVNGDGVPRAAEAITPGARVRVPRWKTTADVLSVQGGKAKLQMGAVRMTVGLEEVELLTTAEAKASRPHRAKIGGSVPFAPDPKLDLRGKRYEEAMSELAAYLDQAYRSDALREVTIVHGIGTGAIREGTRAMLAKLPYVKEFRDGGTGAGGTGATVVEFNS